MAGAVILALALPTAAAVQQGKAEVKSAKGSAEYSTGGAWAPLKSGMILGKGAAIKTGIGGEVRLSLGVNGEAVTITENTTVGIDKLEFDKTGADVVTETQFDLRVGRILGNIKKSSPASRFEIKTPTGVAGIRGTKIDISAGGVVKVIGGCVIVIYVTPSGEISTYEVCHGFKFVPGVGVVPMTNEEMQSGEWNKVTGKDSQTRQVQVEGVGTISTFVSPTLPPP